MQQALKKTIFPKETLCKNCLTEITLLNYPDGFCSDYCRTVYGTKFQNKNHIKKPNKIKFLLLSLKERVKIGLGFNQ
jgi:hypothetical protein